MEPPLRPSQEEGVEEPGWNLVKERDFVNSEIKDKVSSRTLIVCMQKANLVKEEQIFYYTFDRDYIRWLIKTLLTVSNNSLIPPVF